MTNMKIKPITKIPKREVIVVQLQKPLTRILISNRVRQNGDNPKRRGAFSEVVRNALRTYLGV